MSFEVNARRRLDCWDDIVHGDRNIRGVFGEGLERKMRKACILGNTDGPE